MKYTANNIIIYDIYIYNIEQSSKQTVTHILLLHSFSGNRETVQHLESD